jgi:hypothetical protein
MIGAPEYKVWQGVIQRCTNNNRDRADRYVRRGITVCDRWLHSFSDFLEDMGPRPSDKHTIERVNNNKEYSPENCVWASRFVQVHNQEIRAVNTSGVSGVSAAKGKWAAYVKIWYVKVSLGTFDTIEEAAAARQQAEAKIKWLGEDILKAMTPARRKLIIRGW